MTKPTLEERFWSKVEKTDGCWNWTATKNPKGYGEFYNKLRGSIHTRAHQVSWILHFGDIPSGLQICHRCDNPSCVNPSHLFLGTADDNTRDKIEKGRAKVGRIYKGENHPQHGTNSKFSKLDEYKVRKIRELRSTTDLTMGELGKMFGVSSGLINNIIQRRKWAWLK